MFFWLESVSFLQTSDGAAVAIFSPRSASSLVLACTVLSGFDQVVMAVFSKPGAARALWASGNSMRTAEIRHCKRADGFCAEPAFIQEDTTCIGGNAQRLKLGVIVSIHIYVYSIQGVFQLYFVCTFILYTPGVLPLLTLLDTLSGTSRGRIHAWQRTVPCVAVCCCCEI